MATSLVLLLLVSMVLAAVIAGTGSTLPGATGTSRVAVHNGLSSLRTAGAAAPAAGGVGSVIDTLDLVANHLLPGNQQPAVQGTPQMVLYDAANGNLYIRGDDGQTVSVVNASLETALTSFSVGYAGSAYVPNIPTMALDTTTGFLYAASSSGEVVNVIDTTTNLVTGSIALGAAPGGIVFDPASGNFYTSNWGNNNVSIISGSTDKVVASIPVGSEPGAILYDPNDSEVYVSNFNSGNVSVIDTSNETVVASPNTGLRTAEPVALTLNTKDDLVNVVNSVTDNISVIDGSTHAVTTVPVGSVPTSATYDPATDSVLVANGASNSVTVIQQPGESVVASIGIGHGAEGAAYDPSSGYVYTANEGSNNVSIVDPATNKWVGAVTTTNFPEEIAVDSDTGNVYVANLGTGTSDSNLTVISGATSLSIASVGLVVNPTSIVATPNGHLYVTDYAGSGAYLVSDSTNLETGFASAAPEPDSSAYDPTTGNLYIVSEPTGAVTVVSASGAPVTTINLGFGSYGAAYDPTNGLVYISNYYSGNVTLIYGSNNTVDKVIEVQAFDSLGAEIFDPASSSVYVADYSDHNVTVISGLATNGSIQVGTDPTSFAYDPLNDTIFVANYGTANISVVDASSNQLAGSFSAYFPQYLAYDAQSNSLYMVTSENGEVAAYNATSYASLGTPLVIQSSVRAGGIAYSSASGDIYVSNEYDSSISILSSVAVTFYSVWFNETGLPASQNWAVNLQGTPGSSSTSSILFSEQNGSYSFTVGAVTGYTPNTTSGTVFVHGGPVTVSIHFLAGHGPTDYPITFNETGLPAGTMWSVSLTPTESGNSPATAPTSIVFNAPNGTYTFTVGTVTGYSASPSSSSVVVAGLPAYQPITFSAGVSPLSASLTADPANLTLGESTALTTSTTGGTAPYSYVYTGLPAGCATSSVIALSCTPSVTGTFTITVNVTDHAGAHALAHATLRVSSAPGTSGTSGLTTWEWGLIAGLVVLAFLLLLFFLLYRRRRKEPEPNAGAPGSGPPPPPVPPGGSS
ncbi:MAG: hypothetical protein WB809_05045 [Thermoplasmata archaeon]